MACLSPEGYARFSSQTASKTGVLKRLFDFGLCIPAPDRSEWKSRGKKQGSKAITLDWSSQVPEIKASEVAHLHPDIDKKSKTSTEAKVEKAPCGLPASPPKSKKHSKTRSARRARRKTASKQSNASSKTVLKTPKSSKPDAASPSRSGHQLSPKIRSARKTAPRAKPHLTGSSQRSRRRAVITPGKMYDQITLPDLELPPIPPFTDADIEREVYTHISHLGKKRNAMSLDLEEDSSSDFEKLEHVGDGILCE